MGTSVAGCSPLGRSKMGPRDGNQALLAASSIGGSERIRRVPEQRGRLLDNLAFRGRQVARDLEENDKSCEIISKLPAKDVEQFSGNHGEVEESQGSEYRGLQNVLHGDVNAATVIVGSDVRPDVTVLEKGGLSPNIPGIGPSIGVANMDAAGASIGADALGSGIPRAKGASEV
ncbi:hypothetical protein COLO4_29477 [Corchorus olitorius]|uniref:Uncharacterized protein n=1 Tax=Corchorus olitorius TaxID=93759 RepID=A0A1R3HEE0_9ROSI|nr:hypothetical protein COLO4_29477 [Corchorus olitorius]